MLMHLRVREGVIRAACCKLVVLCPCKFDYQMPLCSLMGTAGTLLTAQVILNMSVRAPESFWR